MKKSAFLFFCFLLVHSSCNNDEDQITISTIQEIATLPSSINECSGFTLHNEQLVTVNDSGDGANLYFTTLTDFILTDQVAITNAQNRDWETILSDDNYFWIGDFGNNFGDRMDLVIYKINHATFQIEDSIDFAYPDQTDFTTTTQHNFDCEAMVKIDQALFLFTKNRLNNQTSIYKIDLTEKSITFVQSINVPARVTDAYYHKSSDHVILLCNEIVDGNFESHIQMVQITADQMFSSIQSFSISINQQFEAITLLEGSTFYIGSENEAINGGKIYSFSLSGL